MLKVVNKYRPGFPLCLLSYEIKDDKLFLRFKCLDNEKIDKITVSYRGEEYSFYPVDKFKDETFVVCDIDANLVGDVEVISLQKGSKTLYYANYQSDALYYRQKSIYTLGRERKLYLKTFSRKLKYKKRNIKYIPEQTKDYWRCVCGETNFGNPAKCGKCGAERDLVFQIPTVYGKKSHDTEYLIRFNLYFLLWFTVGILIYVFTGVFFGDFLFPNFDKNNFFGVFNRILSCILIIILTVLAIVGYHKYKTGLAKISSSLRLLVVLYLNFVFSLRTVKTAYIFILLVFLDVIYLVYFLYKHFVIEKMNKFSLVFLILIGCFFLTGSAKLIKYGKYDLEVKSGELKYTVNKNTEECIIPDKLDKVPVTSVLFNKKYAYDKIETLKINKSLKKFSASPNSILPRLKEIKIDSENIYFDVKDNILSQDGKILLVATSVSELTVDQKEVSRAALKECLGLKKLTITKNVEKICLEAFSGCTSLEEIVFEEGLQEIGDEAFSECVSLKKVKLPDSLRKMGKAVFRGCVNMEEINTPFLGEFRNSQRDQLVHFFSVGDYLTYRSVPSSLKKVTVRDVNLVRNVAFYGCKNIEEIILPAGVASIGKNAFAGCSSLTSITIPSNVTSIGSGAFRDCFSLRSITIPAGVKSIGCRAFWNCSSLTINCEAGAKPAGWDKEWNPDNRPVNWGN